MGKLLKTEHRNSTAILSHRNLILTVNMFNHHRRQ